MVSRFGAAAGGSQICFYFHQVHVFFFCCAPASLSPHYLFSLAPAPSCLCARSCPSLPPLLASRRPPSEQEALDVLLNTKCIDPVFNRYYEADFSLKDITGQTALKLATVWECKRIIWKRYMGRAQPKPSTLNPNP